jgi:hypothetical protein
MIKNVVKVNIDGAMGHIIKAPLRMIIGMVTVKCTGLITKFTKASGLMAYKIKREYNLNLI